MTSVAAKDCSRSDPAQSAAVRQSMEWMRRPAARSQALARGVEISPPFEFLLLLLQTNDSSSRTEYRRSNPVFILQRSDLVFHVKLGSTTTLGARNPVGTLLKFPRWELNVECRNGDCRDPCTLDRSGSRCRLSSGRTPDGTRLGSPGMGQKPTRCNRRGPASWFDGCHRRPPRTNHRNRILD